MARNYMRKLTKSRLLGLASSRRKFNSSKKVNEVTYYSLADIESVIATVLETVSEDPSVGITLDAGENGIILNCINDAGDEFTIDVDLESEDGDVAGEDAVVEKVNASRRRMNSSRKKLNSSENSLYAKYYNRFNSMDDAIRALSAHVDDADALPDWVAETEGNGYGDVVGFYIGKDAYFDVLDENNMSVLFVLDDGTVGRQFGRNFYSVSKELKELIDMELLNSSRARRMPRR